MMDWFILGENKAHLHNYGENLNMNNFISVCITSYKRPLMLNNCLVSLRETVDYPTEVIVNFDGVEKLSDLSELHLDKATKVIVSPGANRGVGRGLGGLLRRRSPRPLPVVANL